MDVLWPALILGLVLDLGLESKLLLESRVSLDPIRDLELWSDIDSLQSLETSVPLKFKNLTLVLSPEEEFDSLSLGRDFLPTVMLVVVLCVHGWGLREDTWGVLVQRSADSTL